MMLRLVTIKSTPKRLSFSLERYLSVAAPNTQPNQNQTTQTLSTQNANVLYRRNDSENRRNDIRTLRDLMRNDLKKTCDNLCKVGALNAEEAESEFKKIENWTLALSVKLNQQHPFADLIDYAIKQDLPIVFDLYLRYIRSAEFKRFAQNVQDPRPHLYAPWAVICVKQLKAKFPEDKNQRLISIRDFVTEYYSFYQIDRPLVPLINYLATDEDINFLVELFGELGNARQFASSIINQLLYVDNMDRLKDLMQCMLKTDTDIRIFSNRVQGLLLRKLKAIKVDSTPSQELQTITRVIATGFTQGEETAGGYTLATIFGSSAINDEILKQIINYLMEDPSVLISRNEVVRIENQLRDANMPDRAKLLSRLKTKNSAHARWMNTEKLDSLVKEAESLEKKGDAIKPEVLCSIYDVIMKKAVNLNPINLDVLKWVLPNFHALEKKVNAADYKNYRQSFNHVLNTATNYALLERKFEAFDQLWELRPFRTYPSDQVVVFAMSFFERGENEKAASILSMLKDTAATIDEKTLTGVVTSDFMRTLASEQVVEDFLRLLAENFTISLEWHRRLIAVVQLNMLHKLIDEGKLAEVTDKIALMGEPVIKDSASSFILIDLLKAAIKANNAQIFAKTKDFIETRRDRYTAVLYIGISFLELNDSRWPAMLNKISHIPTEILRQLIKRYTQAKQADVLHSLFNVLNKPETSSIELETLLEETVKLYYTNNDLDGLKSLFEQVKSSSFYLNAKLKVKIESNIKKLESQSKDKDQLKDEDRILTPQPPPKSSSSPSENTPLSK